MQIIGIDCATQAQKTGLARSILRNDALRIVEVCLPRPKQSVADIVADWIRANEQTLLCLDAPLGWPQLLGQTLCNHRAGDPVAPNAHALFRRMTDDDVFARLGKRPLDVGADRIARTAKSALDLLHAVSSKTSMQVELAWDPTHLPRLSAIEVYPAATRRACYLDTHNTDIKDVGGHNIEVVVSESSPTYSEHVHDAIWCAFAGLDFLTGAARPPANANVAKREGWIWVRDVATADS